MSPTLDEIYDGLQRHYTTFASIPEDLHLLCPKLNDEDSEDYDHPDEEGNEITAKEKVERVAKSRKRIETTYYLSLLLGINSDVLQTAFEVWTDRIQTCLHKCEKCVRTWHSMRNGFLKVMIE
jgi:senataxin